jgi:hypothetical protein
VYKYIFVRQKLTIKCSEWSQHECTNNWAATSSAVRKTERTLLILPENNPQTKVTVNDFGETGGNLIRTTIKEDEKDTSKQAFCEGTDDLTKKLK